MEKKPVERKALMILHSSRKTNKIMMDLTKMRCTPSQFMFPAKKMLKH